MISLRSAGTTLLVLVLIAGAIWLALLVLIAVGVFVYATLRYRRRTLLEWLDIVHSDPLLVRAVLLLRLLILLPLWQKDNDLVR